MQFKPHAHQHNNRHITILGLMYAHQFEHPQHPLIQDQIKQRLPENLDLAEHIRDFCDCI